MLSLSLQTTGNALIIFQTPVLLSGLTERIEKHSFHMVLFFIAILNISLTFQHVLKSLLKTLKNSTIFYVIDFCKFKINIQSSRFFLFKILSFKC